MDKKINSAVCIRTFPSRNQAAIAQGALSSQGIQSFVMGDDAGGMYPPLIAGVQLFVSKKDEKKAKFMITE